MKNKLKLLCVMLILTVFTGCYSVFSGGTGGLIVDAESTQTPKAGIANVDVYAYTSSSDCNSDYNRWTEGTIFTPHADYYGHTTTGVDGYFTISKLVWKATKSDFGKDADYTNIYLLFYHEEYGLTKGQTVIISDSTTDTVYAELKSVRKTTNVNIEIRDVANDSIISENIYVKVNVPQTTQANTTTPAKIYEANIIGSGIVSVSYPRWQNEENKAAGIETEPEVIIEYGQSASEITWQGCYNATNPEGNYAFRANSSGFTTVSSTIKNPNYKVILYGKKTKLRMPEINGQYSSAGTQADDGLIVSLKRKDSSGAYTIDCGETSTQAQVIGAAGNLRHGVFSGLGNNNFWLDNTYTGKNSTVDVNIFVSGVSKKIMTLSSNENSYTVQLQ